MSRRFWSAAMTVSLLTTAGGVVFLYKTLLDKLTIEMPLRAVNDVPSEPVVEKPAEVEEDTAPTVLRNIQFVYINSTAKDVFIVGNFEGKETTAKKPMEKNRNKWTINLKLAPGTYEYSYLVNGRSVRDPYNKKTSNGKSLITVKPLPAN